MTIRFLTIILTLFTITESQTYLYTPSALFTSIPPVYAKARQQNNHTTFTFLSTPSDDPIAQMRSIHRSRDYNYKKINYKNTLANLEYILTQHHHTPCYQKRCKSLDKTHNNSKRIKRTTMINHDVSAFAQKYDITSRNLIHTKFNYYEYQLHKEFLKQLIEATELNCFYKQTPAYTVFIDAIGHGISLGIQANQNKETVTATYWADVVWQAIDIAKAVGEGIGLGVYNTAAFGANVVKIAGNVILHPIETVRTIARGIDTVLSFFALDFERQRHRFNLQQELDTLNERIAQIAHHCSRQLSQMSLHNKVKFTTAFATEIVAPAKIFKIAQHLCKRMRPLAAGLINSIREEQVTVDIAGIGKISNKQQIQHLIHETQAVEKAVEKSISQGAKIVDKIKRVLAPSWINQKALATKFEGRIIFNGKSVRIDYNHLFSIEEVSMIKRSGHISAPKITGWHHDFLHTLQKRNGISYENIIPAMEGAFEATPVINSIKYNRKSFFPPNWTEEEVIEKIFEVFERAVKRGLDHPDRKGCYKIIGETREGLKVKIIFDPQQSMITTAYPLIGETV